MASYLTASIKRSYAESFLTELERNENQYFFFVAKSTPWTNENTPSSYENTVKSEYQVMNDIIGYKKLDPASIIFALPRYDWASGTSYDQYDDAVDLFNENDPSLFYVVTDENKIYKCLDNNGGSVSTFKPQEVLSTPFSTDDGYKWQYLSTVRESDLPYELSDYIPVDFAYSSVDTETVNQYNTQIQAVNGSITRLVVTNSEGNSAGVYPNTISKTTASAAIALRIFSYTADGSGKYLTITDTDSVNRISDLDITKFDGYIIRIDNNTVNTSEIGNYAVIKSIVSIVNGYTITLEDDVVNFTLTTQTGGGSTSPVITAEILPYIKIVGNGTGAYAYPEMTSTKRIQSVVVVDGGRDYSKATVEVTSDKTDVTNHPSIRAVISPKGGHGSNILKELNAKDVIIIVKITEDDQEKILDGGSYRQFGIIKNPLVSSTKNLAGKDNIFYRDITLTPISGEPELQRFSGGAFNLIVGSESNSASKIVSVRSLASNTVTVKTVNSSGRFITRQDRISDYFLSLNTQTNAYQTGEQVYQTIPASTVVPVLGYPQGISYSFPVTSTGIVLSSAGSTLQVRLTSNSGFVAGFTVDGYRSYESQSVSAVSPVYGETVYITNTQEGVPTVVSDRNYRILDVGAAYSDQSNITAYNGLTVLQLATSVNSQTGSFDVTSSPLSQNSFTSGETVHQGLTGQFGYYANGVVYRWDFENTSSGKLYLTDVLGSFRNVEEHGITGSTLGTYIVASVQQPEILKTSGEILYIDNVRPIQRAVGQEEEFRLRLGF